MSSTDVSGSDARQAPSVRNLDMKLEVVVIPVSDVERSKAFYENLGWRLDADVSAGDFHLVQLTPPGSGCSVQFGTNLTAAAPGSAKDMYLVVSDVQAAREELIAHGVDVGEIFHEDGSVARFEPLADGRASGPASGAGSYSSFATFSDPDGNVWLFQEVTTRLPGRIDAAETSFASAGDLAGAMRRAAAAHGEHEARTGKEDPDWPDWYAAYMVAEQSGADLPQ